MPIEKDRTKFHAKSDSTHRNRHHCACVDSTGVLCAIATKDYATSKPPAEIQSLIDSHINGFNTHDNNLFFMVFGDTAIIIAGIAPYRWLNPNAPGK